MRRGLVLMGINNIFTVEEEGTGALYECRIKGKVLEDAVGDYNPLAPGDRVEFEEDPIEDHKGYIERRFERKNAFVRYNLKRKAPQTLAANLDLLVCLTSPDQPPFRPRFIDRVLVAAELTEQAEALVLLNKKDLGVPPEVERRLSLYADIGYHVRPVSVKTGEGIPDLVEFFQGKTVVLVGQSGVGKSSLLNTLVPGAGQRVGEISRKYNRGSHVTNYSRLFHAEGFEVIDTPGVREFIPYGTSSRDVGWCFREFEPYAKECTYPSCQHMDEPECAVKEAVMAGRIDPDRYESYLRLREELALLEQEEYE